MELIEHYHPEFVSRFDARETPCDCPACQQAEEAWPHISVKLKNQQRETLDIGCETAAKEMLFNPEAFILHTAQAAPQSDDLLSAWSEVLNQQCINLAVHPALTLDVSLYAIGVLLSKAQQHHDCGESDPALLVSLGEQLATLAEQGVLAQQFAMLPPIAENRIAALKAMGTMRLNLNLPMVEKMGMTLKLSELSIMQPARLAERQQMLDAAWSTLTLFNHQPHTLRNILIYQLYSDIFPGVGCTNYGEALLGLARQFFHIKMLCAIRAEQGELTQDDVALLVSALRGWQQQNPLTAEEGTSSDYSLLCGLALL
ncbi:MULTISPECIES: hypothetical protein [Enterobacteriaceae]|uniref:Lysine-N-methylase n=1 Tax=Kluyvera genomosp. 2 TaxID=2774054 RepID=A0A2T2Y561_9ENTR|nr:MULTISPECIES: hypothetical protein [Enterobacteriaceae]HAT3916950.1 hypothetical protein [Kluyvera ascorbata]PSR47676.1 hypothetical protein C8256_04950 [Kluyvera genomosp. 2]BBQ81571.1 lysine-N-methylase [Klebsiella sp. WP3-W18-ESBL-02]BBR18620.1 lysine-N-methylase [Klebsiella sp. WP3-S18-ESBL-05]BBR56737.1 lysine-N-methylase [Klebsiella sp. WP4-W18-ESBL-05]